MKLFTYMTAAAIAVGGVATVGCKDDGRSAQQQVNDGAKQAADTGKDVAKKTGEAVKDGAQQAGSAIKGVKDDVVANTASSGSDKLTGMRGAMEGLLQNALGGNDFKTMTNHLVKADKDRLEAQAPTEMPEHTQAVKAFQDAWKAKYGGDLFKVMDSDAVFNDQFAALAGEPRKQGMATIKASHGMPEVKLQFADDAGKWRLDVADGADANKFRAGLAQAAKELTAQSATWPADKAEASRLVAHRVFMVLADTGGSMPSGSPAAPSGSTADPARDSGPRTVDPSGTGTPGGAGGSRNN